MNKTSFKFTAGALIGATALVLTGTCAHAQQTAKVIATCGTASYTAGTTNYVTQDTTGAACGSSGGGGGTVTANQGTAGSQPWPIKIDQTTPGTTNGVQVNAALPAGANVIGHVINDASSAVIGHVIADTGSTTAVTGNVTVVQPTGTNLHAVLDAGSAIAGKVGVDQTTPGTTNAVSIAQIGATTVLTGGVAGSQGVGGLAANNATASGNPIPGSCLATSAEATVATNGQNAECVTDLAHKQIVLPYANPENFVSGTTAAMTGTTSTSLLAAPSAGLRNYVTSLQCVNSHATVGTFVTVQDGSGGTALMTVAAASVFGGSAVTLPTPLRQPTTATALFVADVTTGANVICSAQGYKGS